jgi:hypothetical protein
LVGLGRVELPTSPLSGVRSSHLSYRPLLLLADPDFAGTRPLQRGVISIGNAPTFWQAEDHFVAQ